VSSIVKFNHLMMKTYYISALEIVKNLVLFWYNAEHTHDVDIMDGLMVGTNVTSNPIFRIQLL